MSRKVVGKGKAANPGKFALSGPEALCNAYPCILVMEYITSKAAYVKPH
jgi:hypothetical protein